MYSVDAVWVPDVLILPGRATANLLDNELRARILGNENSADVLANRADTDQLNAACEQDGNDRRRPSLRPLCPYQCLENEICSKGERNQRDNSTQERCHSQRND